jgi:Fe-S cluster assembly protein SufD
MNILSENISPAEHIVSLFEQNIEMLNQGSSAILNQLRETSVKRFAQAGIPDSKTEDYKYTNLKPAFEKSYQLELTREPAVIDLNVVFKHDIPQLNTHLVFLVNGWFFNGNNPAAGLPQGVVLGSLEQIANQHPEMLRNYLNKQATLSNDPFVALNTAFAKDGFFLYIPKGIVIDKPLQIINLLGSDQDLMVTQRNLVITEAGAQVKILTCDQTLTPASFLYNSVTETFSEENSKIDFYSIQNQHNQSTSIHSEFFDQQRNTVLNTATINLHAGFVRNNLKIVFNGDHAEANVYGVTLTDKKQHADNFVLINHDQPNCVSTQIFKNILDGESTGAFAGRIHVARDAQQTNAFQRNNNVLLSDKAKMQTKPQLIIDADDVKCSHGATIGQIDEEALFFMRSRGIGEKEARTMLMNAFAHEVIQKITIESLCERLNKLIEKRLNGEISLSHENNYPCNC